MAARTNGRRQHLTPEVNEARLKLYHTGATDKAIAVAEGVTANAIALWRHRRQLQPNRDPRLTAQESARRTSLLAMGLGDRQAAEKLGVSRTAIKAWRKKKGVAGKCRRERDDGEIALISTISLNAPGINGREFGEIFADMSWSSWLEEMGATVW